MLKVTHLSKGKDVLQPCFRLPLWWQTIPRYSCTGGMPSHIDTKLGHVTCFEQKGISMCYSSKDLISHLHIVAYSVSILPFGTQMSCAIKPQPHGKATWRGTEALQSQPTSYTNCQPYEGVILATAAPATI